MVKVFLSSTGRDLKPFRETTHAAIGRLQGFASVRMEDFGAGDAPPLATCLEQVQQCDVFVGIVGHCHGSTPLDDYCSFTEHEYTAANGKPRLMFVAPDDFLLPANLRESDDAWNKQQRFRSRVLVERVVAPFNSPDNLASRVVEALANWHRGVSKSEDDRSEDLPPRYRIVRTIGAGQSAIVSEATDLRLGRSVAVKEAKPGLIKAKPHYIDVFRREAKHLARLDHPNVIPLYEYHEPTTGPLLIMKLAGRSLIELGASTPLRASLPIARIARQIAAALDHCAERGISHRDIKPDNILLDGSGQLFLVDFGLAASFDDEVSWSEPTGAAPYLSPEMIGLGEGGHNRRYSDQFSFGVTLYQLITGSLPLDPVRTGGSSHDRGIHCTAARLKAGEEPVACSERDSSVPPALDRVLARMLSVSPHGRYPNNTAACEELINALGAWELRCQHLQPSANRAADLHDLSRLPDSQVLDASGFLLKSDGIRSLLRSPEAAERQYVNQEGSIEDFSLLPFGNYVPRRYQLDAECELRDQADTQLGSDRD